MRTGDTNDHDHTCAELTDARSALSHLGQTELGAHLHYSILPLLQQQPTANLSKHDVLNLLSTLLKLDKHLLRFELSCSSEYSCFFSSLVALSVNCIISNAAASKCML